MKTRTMNFLVKAIKMDLYADTYVQLNFMDFSSLAMYFIQRI